MTDNKICIICFNQTKGIMDEHNPEPYQHSESGRCCSSCNDIYVVPASEILPKRIVSGKFKKMTIAELVGHSNPDSTIEAYEENS